MLNVTRKWAAAMRPLATSTLRACSHCVLRQSTAFRQAARSPDCPSCLYGRGRAAALCYRRVRLAVRACVLQLGASWHSVAQLCLVGRYQPLLLLYANADVKPLDVSTAPDIVTRLPEPLPAVSRGLT